jgi:hypothetical protein
VNGCVVPLAIEGFAGVTAMEVNVAGVFVSEKLAGVVTPGADAVTV